MKYVEGIALPDGDQHFTRMLPGSPKVDGKGTYQLRKFNRAMEYVERTFLAVDIGGHVGLWSRVMARRFTLVHAFEPLAAHRECFVENTKKYENICLFPYALGSEPGEVLIHMPHDNTGHAHVSDKGEPAKVVTLDSISFPTRIDFLKIDVEGYELEVVKGGAKTIKAMRPVIIIEQKVNNAEMHGGNQYDALRLLLKWGAREVAVLAGDHILVW